MVQVMSRANILTGVPFLVFSMLVNTVLAGPPGISENGIIIHQLESPYQGKETSLRVLLPDDLKEGQRYRVLFILPVHEDGLFSHGDGLVEAQKLNIHNLHQLICVAPAFSSAPWYADHDQDPAKQDESHLLKTIIPFLEAHYPVRTDRNGRLLVGFSKSGWGAMSLLLRHPDIFHKAAAWDSGIRVDVGPTDADYNREDKIRKNFGSDENFGRFRVTTLLKTRGKELGDEVRLFYYSCDKTTRTIGGSRIHNLMVEEGIPHRYLMEPYREHRWDSGWMAEAVDFLTKE